MPVVARPAVLDDAERAAVLTLAASVAAEDGAPPLTDQALTQLASLSVSHLLAVQDGTVVGYAQREGGHAEIVAVRSGLAVLLDAVDAPGLLVWSHGGGSRLATALEQRGYDRVRVLHRLERDLGQPVPFRPVPDGVTVSTFRVGVDERDWLRINAAAFATHPEQGGWTAEDLRARESAPWFDPVGFFLARRDATVVGFHWTKIHPDGAGEVYVIGVDPGEQGTGLGGALLALGLDHLRSRGRPRALLYVDDANTAALRLYQRFGFHEANRDVQWQRR